MSKLPISNDSKLSKRKLNLYSPVFEDISFTTQGEDDNDRSNSSIQLNVLPQYYYQSYQPMYNHYQQGPNREESKDNRRHNNGPQNNSKKAPAQPDKKPKGDQGSSSPIQTKQQGDVVEHSGQGVDGAEKTKKRKPNKKKNANDVESHPWAKPLKRVAKGTDILPKGEIKVGVFRGEKNPKRVEEEAKLNNVSGASKEEKDVKKIKFVRARDIIAQHQAKRRLEDQGSKKRSNQVVRKLFGLNKKKKYSKVKKAKLKYLEIKSQEEKWKDQQEMKKRRKGKVVNDDGFETIDEGDADSHDDKLEPSGEIAEKDRRREEYKEDRENIPLKSGSRISEKVIDTTRYEDLIPELRLPDEKRPQLTYRDSFAVRKWVDQIVCPEIDERVFQLLNKLLQTQTLKKLNQPNKFKKRILCGMREVLRSIESNLAQRSAQCIIIAINIQENPLENGGDEKILEIIHKAKRRGTPVIYACTRKQLGQACTGNDFARISAVSVTNYFGVDELYKELLELAKQKRVEFKEFVNNVE